MATEKKKGLLSEIVDKAKANEVLLVNVVA